MTSWAKSIANAAQNAATPHQNPPETAQLAMQINPPHPPENAPQRRTDWLTSPDRILLYDAIEAGTTARALHLALQVIAALTGDGELVEANAQNRAAMGEEWRRAYKVWATHAPRIRAAMTEAERLAAYGAASDACLLIAEGTSHDGMLLGVAVLDMLGELLKNDA